MQDPNLEYGTEADGVKIIKDMELFNEKAKNDDGTYDFSKMKLGSDGNWYTPSPYEKGENVEMCKICKCVCDCVCVVCKIDIHNPMKGVIDSIGKSVGRNGQFVAAARGGGWTKDNCVGNGISLSGAIAALYSAPICAAIGVGLGAPACMAAVGAAGAAITGIACTQLCNDGNLRGADCGNP